MNSRFTQVGRQRAAAMWGDWTDRIAGGELPFDKPVAAAGQGTKRRRDDVGLGGSEGVSPRRDRERQAESDGKPQRPDLWSPRGQRRLHACRRSEDQYGVENRASGARSEDAERGANAAGAAVAVLGRRSDLDEPVQRPQFCDGQAGSCVDCRAHPSESDIRFLPAGFRSSVRKGVPDRSERAPDADVRSQDEAGHDHRHVLRHPPSELRRQGHPVVYRRRAGRGLVQHSDLRRDQRREEGSGLDRVRARHERQRQARRVRRARCSRSIRPRTSGSTRRSTV